MSLFDVLYFNLRGFKRQGVQKGQGGIERFKRGGLRNKGLLD